MLCRIVPPLENLSLPLLNYCLIAQVNNVNARIQRIFSAFSRTNIQRRETLMFIFFKILFLERGSGGERERNINVWLPFERPLLRTWPATQACALTGNQTSEPLVRRPALNPLSHTSRGSRVYVTEPLFWYQQHNGCLNRYCILQTLAGRR